MTTSADPIAPSSLSARQWAPILAVLIVGVATSIGSLIFGRHLEARTLGLAFHEDAEERAVILANDISGMLATVTSLRAYYMASEEVTRDEFRLFAHAFLSTHAAIQALEWIPRIPDSQRALHEMDAQRDGLLDYQITERESRGTLVRAKQRGEYFPVRFAEPPEGNSAVVGFDLGSDSTRRRALHRSRDTGKMVSTSRITLVQGTGKQHGFLAFLPVYASLSSLDTILDRRKHLVGFVLGVFRIGEVMARSLDSLDPAGIDIGLYDLDAPEGEKLLHVYRSHQTTPGGRAQVSEDTDGDTALQYTRTFDVAGRRWEVRCSADPALFSEGRTWIPWEFLLSGLAITFLMTANMLSAARQNMSVSRAYVKLAEEAGQRAESDRAVERTATELTQLIDTANAPIFGVDVDGNINEWNQMTARITGYTREDTEGQNLVETYITDEYKSSVTQVLDNALAGEEMDNYEVPLFTRDGERVMVLLNATTRRDADGHIVGVVGVGQDITELSDHRDNLKGLVDDRTSELNAALADTESARDKIGGILKSIADGLIVTDAYNRIVLMNPVAEDLLGVRLSEVIDRAIEYAIDEPILREKVRETLDRKATGSQFDFELMGDDMAHTRVIRARASLIHDREGKESGTVTTMHDVTHESEVDRMKTEFISTAAHELRTPLTSIQGFSEILLLREDLEPRERERFLTYINRQSVGLAGIINDLLDISRIESGRGFTLSKVPCKAGDAVRQVVPFFQEQYKSHKFEVSLPDESVELHVDKDKMEQVLKNLLSNAAKYSPDGGEIRVTGEMAKDCFQISVEDQGLGMTPEQVERMFDKFYRADSSNTAIEGTGLGTTIVKHVVEAHGGKVWVESELGKGTIVRFTIPA
jgi:PAS domain S-box-containing protein